MGLFSFLRRENPFQAAAVAIYNAIVAQARTAVFYSELGVPDSLNGRFDMVVLHATLAIRRVRKEPPEIYQPLSQALFDYMFQDMDRSLREVGVGDMSIGKHIKKMAKGFYGRAGEYEAGLDQDGAGLAEALKRNLYRALTPGEAQVDQLARYVRAADAALSGVEFADFAAGRMAWPEVRVAGA
ncbi:MAG: ubiquinol-cytochrome C chaperone family protein [Rhodospirillaceae bacterium]|nr:ubiquinol-cytochrome C chaperone family protein [Rhodospirillaceae bacterium]